MCGINGIYNFSQQQISDPALLVANMNKCIAHRGPDDTGYWSNQQHTLHLGHQRLSIIDLSAAGHQPMTDANGTIVFNGEIYNYQQLRSLIPSQDYAGNSDTEVLMKLLAIKGTAALTHLNGMFAFAWWNAHTGKLLLARDRIGKKPLYYTVQNGILAFSSEVQALLTLPWVKALPDDESLYHFLTFNQVSAPHTIFKNIYKLPPASYIIAGAGGIEKEEKYWDIEYSLIPEQTEEAISGRLLTELKQAVGRRMVADVPVGAFLSGGVDSSSIVALMHQSGFKNIKTYAVGFHNQPDYTELKYAEKIASQYQTEHFEKIVKPDDLRELMPLMASVFDEPLADATAIPIWFISKLARDNGTIVVQTGDGSDEIFSGYRNWARYARYYPLFNIYQQLPLPLKKMVAAMAGSGDASSPLQEMLVRAVNKEAFFQGGAKAFKESTKSRFLTDEWKRKMLGIHSYSVIQKVKSDFEQHASKFNLNAVDWMCYLGVKQQIPERYLYRMDKLGMANSIEIRSPFLDYELVNYAMSIPSHFKIKNGIPKYILKKSLEGTLDHEILYRKKMGFCVPLREWAGEIMTDYIQTNMDKFCRETGVFHKEGIKQLLTESKHGNDKTTNQLFTIYFLMAWYERWIY